MENKKNIPEWWVETTLGEIADIKMWQSPKWESYNQNWDWIPFYQWITEFWDKYVKLKTFTNSPTKIVKQWTILFSVRAPVWKINFTNWECCIGRWNAWINIIEWDQNFLYFKLKFIEKEIQNLSSGTVFESINWNEVKNISLTIPENPKEQKAIADILSSLDDKIELLKNQNQTLEKIWQTLFQHYFGKYKIWDKLPEGWREWKLGDELETFLWWTPSKEKDEYWKNWNIPWINSWEINNFRITKASEYITELWLEKSATKLLPKWTVVLAITWATLWQYSILEFDCCFNQSVVWIKPNEELKTSYIYYYIKNNIKYLVKSATWWAHQHVNKDNINNMDFIIPNKTILSKFYNIAENTMMKISINEYEINNLSKIRDTLLPQLMSWKIRVWV